MKRAVTIVIALAVLLTAGTAAALDGSGALLNEFNTSVRAEAMGGAGVALVWGQQPDRWANPALLAYADGLRFSKYESQLAAGIASGIRLTNEEFTIGGDGWGLLLADGPVGGTYLDMGTQYHVDDTGTVIDAVDSWMRTESVGVAVDFVRVANRIAGREIVPGSEYFSLSGGYVRKSFKDALAPDWALADGNGGSGAGKSRDIGLLLKVVPLDTSDEGGLLGSADIGLRLGLAAGWSVLDGGDDRIVHTDVQQADPFPRRFVRGWSAHVALPLSASCRERFADDGLGLLVRALDPFLSFTWSKQLIEPGVVWDPVAVEYQYSRDNSGDFDEKSDGWEVGFGNFCFIRRGTLDSWGSIDGPTEGRGLNLPIGDWGGLRWEKATVPQATGFPDVTREVWSIWLGSSFTSLF